MRKDIVQKIDSIIQERLDVIYDIMKMILGYKSFEIIKNTKTYNYLLQKDYGTIQDSPQANLSSIGADLREQGNKIGEYITDANIKNAMKLLRVDNKDIKNKVLSIVKIIIKMLNCEYAKAFVIVAESYVFKAFIEGDNATLYQSDPCCIEDIGRELKTKGIPYAMLFSSENITKAILAVREENNKNRIILENKIMVKVQV